MTQKLKVIFVREAETESNDLINNLKNSEIEAQFSVVATESEMRELLDADTWDLVIADGDSHYFNGIDAVQILQSRGINIPVVFLGDSQDGQRYARDLHTGGGSSSRRDQISQLLKQATERTKSDEGKKTDQERMTPIEYDGLFRESPVPLWLEDFSEIKTYLEQLKNDGVQDFEQYFAEHPDAVKSCLERLKIIDVNKETIRLYQAQDKLEIIRNPIAVFEQETFFSLIGELSALARGELEYSCELSTKTLRGEHRFVLLKLSVMPGFEKSFSRVLVTTIDLTERKKIEHELKIKEAAFSSSLTGIGIEDLRGRLTYVNQAMAEMWGYDDASEVIGTTGEQYWRDQKKAHAAFVQVLRSGRWTGELVGVKKDGSHFDVKISATAIYNEQGSPVLAMGSFEDVTEQKKAQIATKESEAIFHALFANNQAVILLLDVSDSNLPIVDANDAAVAFYGYNYRQLLTMTMMDLNTLPAAETRRRINAYRKKNKTIFEFQHRLASGETRDVETYSGPIDVRGKKLVYVAVHDVTERKRMERALQQSEERYRMLAENSPNAILVHSNNKIVYANQETLKILGAKEQGKILHSEILDFVHPNFRDAFRQRMHLLYSHKTVPLVEYQFVRSDGKIVDVEIADAFVYFQGQPASQVVFRDITHRKRAERIQQFLVRISGAILSAEDLNDLFEIIHRELGKVIDTTNFYIALYDKNTEMIVSPYYRDEKKHNFRMFPADKNLTACVIKQRQPLLVSERELQRMIDDGELEDMSEKPKVWLGVPLQARNHVIGAIVVQSYQDENAFGKEELEILKFISDQIGISIERKQREEEIHASLKEKIVLLKEIHHRVKNNLQVISSLLYLQSKYVKDDQALKVFEESRHRVRSMSLVHEKLYQSQNLAQIPFKNYIVDLARYLFRSYNADPFKIRLETDIADVALSVDIAIPCGLLINELISNAIKYAFPNQRKGMIKIKLVHDNKNHVFELAIRDNGVGIGDYLKEPTKSSLGLQLVDTLVDQINGKMEIETDEGTAFIIRFEEKYE
ncbi:MAG: PAS domain S-box protein [Calditrichaeota bacterium]|nr:PAS domain S-box protein [Calditrichota bacterium]